MTRQQEIVSATLDWYDRHRRDLPWRQPDVSGWGVLVSEVMLQQTPVARVIEPWQTWMQRWPTPSALAAEPVGAAVAAWGRLGYPRRAMRLHQAATDICVRFDGEVPAAYDDLISLPGVGDYTAAAVASFGYGQRQLVLDTNVRRVLARVESGQAMAAPTVTAAERELAATFVPDDPKTAARWAVASMELGALVCTASNPDCPRCPIAAQCRWLAAGKPEWDGPRRAPQAWDGTDRQCRGVLLARLREAPNDTVGSGELLATWTDPEQAQRCLGSLLADGLVQQDGDRYRL